MKYTTLGKTGLKVSVVGLGGIPVQRTDLAEAKEIVKACMEQGINYLDTARGYTVSEEFFGEALKATATSGFSPPKPWLELMRA